MTVRVARSRCVLREPIVTAGFVRAPADLAKAVNDVRRGSKPIFLADTPSDDVHRDGVVITRICADVTGTRSGIAASAADRSVHAHE